MSKENVELARSGYEALMSGDLEAVERLFAADLDWCWWEPGPWDCHSREDAMKLIRERIGQRAIGVLVDVIDVDDERIVVVTRRRSDSERSYADMGVEEGHDEFANVVTIRDGRVISMRSHRTKAEALAAAARSQCG